MPKITVLTIAYNAEKTLKRAIESIVRQSFHDFEYVIVDHGSTDKTREIIQDYEMRIPYVHGVYLDKNGVVDGDMSYTQKLQIRQFKRSNAPWGVCLDADDEYNFSALEDMLAFAEKTHCDIVCCGTRFVEEQTKQQFGLRMMENNGVIADQQSWDTLFPYYHQHMRTFWAKLISLDILRNPEFTMDKRNIMGDTGFMLAAFENAKSVGFLAKPLYTWYYSEKSTSHTLLTQSRVDFNKYCYTRAVDFLKVKCGTISPANHEFMLVVFMNELIDSFQVLFTADMKQMDKFQLLCSMFLNEYSYSLAASNRFGSQIGDEANCTARRKSLFTSVITWLFSVKDVPDEKVECYCELGEFVSAAAENGDAWVVFKELRVKFLIDQGRMEEAVPKVNELRELLPNSREIRKMAAKVRKRLG